MEGAERPLLLIALENNFPALVLTIPELNNSYYSWLQVRFRACDISRHSKTGLLVNLLEQGVN